MKVVDPIDVEHEERLADQAAYHKIKDSKVRCTKCKSLVLANWERCAKCGHTGMEDEPE